MSTLNQLTAQQPRSSQRPHQPNRLKAVPSACLSPPRHATAERLPNCCCLPAGPLAPTCGAVATVFVRSTDLRIQHSPATWRAYMPVTIGCWPVRRSTASDTPPPTVTPPTRGGGGTDKSVSRALQPAALRWGASMTRLERCCWLARHTALGLAAILIWRSWPALQPQKQNASPMAGRCVTRGRLWLRPVSCWLRMDRRLRHGRSSGVEGQLWQGWACMGWACMCPHSAKGK